MAGHRLLILGGGFGGLDVARSIARSRAARGYWDTLLIDKENFFQFNPLLPAVAVGSVETRHIVYPLREMARHRRIRFIKNKAIAIDLEQRRVELHNGLSEPYDTLVIAVGSVTNWYGVPGAQAHARPFKTIVDAMTLRARVVELFEMAEQARSDAQRRRLLSFVIVGGGVTGVEVGRRAHRDVPGDAAPALSHALRLAPERDRPRGRGPAGPRGPARALGVRGALPRPARRPGAPGGARHPRRPARGDAARRPHARGVHVRVDGGGDAARAGPGLPLRFHTDGRVVVDGQLRALRPDGSPLDDVYVIGDCAASPRAPGRMQSQLAQTAIAMGMHVGDALVRRARGRAAASFAYHDPGYIISLGKHSSVLDLFGIPLSGKLAWLIWAGAYLVKMVGLRKQIEVGIDHLTHLWFEHDTSQILNRRVVLSDDELNLALADSDAEAAPSAPSGPTPPPTDASAPAPRRPEGAELQSSGS
jgi:NADH dehydrogenase